MYDDCNYIKNIYWMLAYAFKSLNPKDNKKVSSEKFENIYELFAVMMTNELNKQVKRGLNKEYILKEEDLLTLKGKISINESIKTMSLIKNKIICEYDEYSTNSYLNRIIKTACNYLIASNKIMDKTKLKNLKRVLVYLKDVDVLDKSLICWSAIRYNQNNVSYKILTNISYLIIKGLLINKEDGSIDFRSYIDDQDLHVLYEKFILEYYRYHHKELVPASTRIDWNVEKNEYIELLPKMKTDITLKYNDRILIIDAKCYLSIFQNNLLYNKTTFHSNNLYQIYTYVKNEDKGNNGSVSGLLLYAKREEDDIIDNKFNMNGNIIGIANLNLNKDFNEIKYKLEQIVEEFKYNNSNVN